MNLLEIMQKAAGGEAFKAYAAMFGVTEEDAARAVEAFLPAFSLGLKQNAADPLGLAEIMRRFATGDYRSFFRAPEKAPQVGSEILAFMLGSQDIARKIADQASLATGIATETLKAMMPSVAATMMGGLQQEAAKQNPFFDAMLKAFQGAGAPDTDGAPKGPLDRQEEGAELPPHLKAQRTIFEAGLGAMRAGAAAWTEAATKMGTPPGKGGKPGNPFADFLEPGLWLNEAYQRNIEAIFAAAKRTP